MPIDNKVEQVKNLLERLRQYDHLIAADGLELDTVKDIRDAGKALCDQAKDIIDGIKDEIDLWE